MMDQKSKEVYKQVRSGGTGYFREPRGFCAVWGGEAVQFLNGLITNDISALKDGAQMRAAFPNAQGRLIAVVRVLRRGDKFYFETENATRETVIKNLMRFTMAGDFFVEDLSDQHDYVSVHGRSFIPSAQSLFEFDNVAGTDYLVAADDADDLLTELEHIGAVELPKDVQEVLRIEAGVPVFGVDMDETTIVPEIGTEGLISYSKGCYIGQEIIARIHFRGHVAKQLRGLKIAGSSGSDIGPGAELSTEDGKNAGRITSVTFSPKLNSTIALGYVRYEYLPAGTELIVGDLRATVADLPFI